MNLTNPLEQEDWNFDIVDLCSIYLEGYILTPIGVLGIIGKKILYAAICPWYNELDYIYLSMICKQYGLFDEFHFNLGNVLSIAILATKDLRNGFSDLLITLSAFDTMYLVMAILIHGVPKLNEHYNYNILPILMPIW